MMSFKTAMSFQLWSVSLHLAHASSPSTREQHIPAEQLEEDPSTKPIRAGATNLANPQSVETDPASVPASVEHQQEESDPAASMTIPPKKNILRFPEIPKDYAIFKPKMANAPDSLRFIVFRKDDAWEQLWTWNNRHLASGDKFASLTGKICNAFQKEISASDEVCYRN